MPVPEPTECTFESLRDGLLQDLLAVRVLTDQAQRTLPAEAGALRDALREAGRVLDADIGSVRAALDRLREGEAA